MVFKAAFIAHTPDADPEKHKWEIGTSKYRLFIRFVKSQTEAIKASKDLLKEEGIHSIILCPGFTHKDVAEISEAVGENVAVCVSRGDGPGSRISMAILKKEGWF
ncbi:MAG: DUF6506 family protein [Candidatus Hodarchaeota archaeon]